MGRVMFVLVLLVVSVRSWAGDLTAKFDIQTDNYAGPAFVGFGADMNPYLFCRPNWGAVNEKNVANLEQKVMALGPQHVRIFFLNEWTKGHGDQYVSKGDPRTYESFVKTVQIAQKAGASVNVTLWYDPQRWKNPDAYAEKFAKNVARMIRKDHLTAVKYITIQNEPDGFPAKGEEKKITLPKYVAAYRAFDRAMKKLGLRDRVKIIAGDLVSDQQAEWVKYLGPHMVDLADGYSIHAYWNYWKPDWLLARLNDTEKQFGALPAHEQKPLYVTEFGTRGLGGLKLFDPGLYSNGRPIEMVPIAAMEDAWFALKAVNDGFVALSLWDMYDSRYDVLLQYGIMGQAQGGWACKPGYYMLKLLTHTCKPGWRAIKVNGATKFVTAAAMKSPDGQMSVWAVNHGPRGAMTTFAGLEPGKKFHLVYWNYNGEGLLCDAGDVRVNGRGGVRLYVPVQAMVAVTDDPAAAPRRGAGE